MLKLSAAIRIGSMTTKQICFDATDGGNGRCAIGAALDASGIVVKQNADWIVHIQSLFPVARIHVKHFLIEESRPLYQVIYLLNDIYRWTREQIADYVETVENELEAKEKKEHATTSLQPV